MKTNYILKLAAAAALIAILPVTPSVFADSKGKDKDNKHKQNEHAQKHDSGKGKPGKHDCHYPCHYKDCKNKPPFTKPPKPPKPPYCPPPSPPVVTNCEPKPPIVVTNCPPVPPSATNCVTEYSGRAVIIDLTNSHLGTSIVLGDTGDLPPTGGMLEKTLGASAVDNTVFLEAAHAGTMGANGVSESAVTITNFLLRFVTQSGKEYRIAADFIQVMVTAECTASGIVTHASSIVQGLELNDIPLTVTGQPHQQFLLKEGLLTVNLQSQVLSGNCAEVSAAAMHLYVTNCYSGFIGVAHADICCCETPTTPPVPCPPKPPVPPQTNICGKVTGGGFIVATPSGAKGSFSVGGGIRRGEFWGHLNYIDHGTGMHVHATAVTGFVLLSPTTAQIDYNVTIDGAPGTARVIVTDNGEPGRNDIFDITLSTGYHAGGDLGGPGPGGGNIQMHKCPPGWAK
jgi:hypothetical protein